MKTTNKTETMTTPDSEDRIASADAIKINIYRASGTWYGARWIGGEYDGCDELPVGDAATETQARTAAERMHLAVSGPRTIVRVEDT